ncbi:MAG: hypothetical protein WBA44_11675 [Mesorhizobium sp.]
MNRVIPLKIFDDIDDVQRMLEVAFMATAAIDDRAQQAALQMVIEMTKDHLLSVEHSLEKLADNSDDDSDPLLTLVRNYETALAECNALPNEVEDPKTWEPYYDQLRSPPAATTREGAIAALRLIQTEETTCGSPPFTAQVIGAALPFLELEEGAA